MAQAKQVTKEEVKLSVFTGLEVQGYENVIQVPFEVDGVEVTKEYIKDLKENLATEFGGFSYYVTNGGWVNNEGKLIEEKMYVFTVTFDPENTDLLEAIYDIASGVKEDLAQDCVYVRIGDKVYFV